MDADSGRVVGAAFKTGRTRKGSTRFGCGRICAAFGETMKTGLKAWMLQDGGGESLCEKIKKRKSRKLKLNQISKKSKMVQG